MTSSAHAYVRGNTRRFYEWLLGSRGRSLPDAPSIWIGGDCHVGNLGPVASKSGEVDIELRDLDQTVVGSPAHDIVRLALSLAMAVRASALPGVVTAHVMEAIARGYEVVLETKAARREFTLGKPPAEVLQILRQAGRRSRRRLFVERIGHDPRVIPMGPRFWPLTGEERAAVERLVETKKIRKLMTSLASRDDDAQVKLVDAAFWVKGCSSLGLWRCAALVEVGGGDKRKSGASGPLALIDVKEARPPLAPRVKRSAAKTDGERVVAGARALSPGLGERMAAASVLDRSVFVRELLPQDLKFELSALTRESALAVARYLASVVAVAHARQLDGPECAAWLEAFRRGNAKNMNAPAWLWAAVVDLVALHEGAYLEHCREHAMGSNEAAQAHSGVVLSHHVTGD
jgi:uncharacterized protein (DUF2252 family)